MTFAAFAVQPMQQYDDFVLMSLQMSTTFPLLKRLLAESILTVPIKAGAKN